MRILSCLGASSLLVLAALAGCSSESSSSSSSSSSGGAGDGGADTGPIGCLTEGLMKVTISGLPAGLAPKVNVAGPETSDLTESKDLELPTGDYTIKAADVASPDPIARTLYRATVSPATATLCSGPVNVTVTYAAIGSSGKVWAGNANGTAPVLGFASSALGATATIPASVAAKTRGARGMAFDKDGNLWTIGGTTADTTLGRYAAAGLAASGTPAPDRKIDIKTGCGPNATHLAFDPSGNLWVNMLCEDRVVRLSPSELAADGEVVPSVSLSGIDEPRGLAFDSSGNLWVSAKTVHRYDASRLNASSTDPANAILTLPEDSDYVAFDQNGDLWSVGGSNVNLVHVAKANLGGTGPSTPAVASSISVGVGALPQAIAFDESGGLWISAPSGGKIARLAPDQLMTSTTYAAPTVPERVFTSDDIGSAGDIAIFPAPAGLPIYHRAE